MNNLDWAISFKFNGVFIKTSSFHRVITCLAFSFISEVKQARVRTATPRARADLDEDVVC